MRLNFDAKFVSSKRNFGLFVRTFFLVKMETNLKKLNKEMNSILAFIVANIDRCDRYSTNRFHVAERLFSNRSQLTSKCGKNWDVAHSPEACDRFYYIFTSSVIYCWTDPKQNGMNLFYTMITEEKNTDTHTSQVPVGCLRIWASLGIF